MNWWWNIFSHNRNILVICFVIDDDITTYCSEMTKNNVGLVKCYLPCWNTSIIEKKNHISKEWYNFFGVSNDKTLMPRLCVLSLWSVLSHLHWIIFYLLLCFGKLSSNCCISHYVVVGFFFNNTRRLFIDPLFFSLLRLRYIVG